MTLTLELSPAVAPAPVPAGPEPRVWTPASAPAAALRYAASDGHPVQSPDTNPKTHAPNASVPDRLRRAAGGVAGSAAVPEWSSGGGAGGGENRDAHAGAVHRRQLFPASPEAPGSAGGVAAAAGVSKLGCPGNPFQGLTGFGEAPRVPFGPAALNLARIGAATAPGSGAHSQPATPTLFPAAASLAVVKGRAEDCPDQGNSFVWTGGSALAGSSNAEDEDCSDQRDSFAATGGSCCMDSVIMEGHHVQAAGTAAGTGFVQATGAPCASGLPDGSPTEAPWYAAAGARGPLPAAMVAATESAEMWPDRARQEVPRYAAVGAREPRAAATVTMERAAGAAAEPCADHTGHETGQGSEGVGDGVATTTGPYTDGIERRIEQGAGSAAPARAGGHSSRPATPAGSGGRAAAEESAWRIMAVGGRFRGPAESACAPRFVESLLDLLNTL